MTIISNGPTRGLAALILPIAVAAIAVTVSQEPSRADEGGVSFWVPGQFGSLAAVPAQPGWSFATVGSYTEASASYRVAAPGSITLGTLRERVPSDFVNANYVFATPVLGGQLAMGMTGVFGRTTVSIDEVQTASIGGVTATRTSSMSDSRFTWGDLYPMASLRWNHGVHNFMIYGTGDIPVGTYDPSNLANMGIGHGAADGGFGYTYFNPATGHEFSVVTGATYNLKNTQTDYQNGIDWHLDWGISKFLSKQFFVGAVGYVYQQLTADKGQSPLLGEFKSRVLGVGPQLGYLFPFADMQGYLNVKGYYEFDAQNRPSGWNAWVTLAVSPAEKPAPGPLAKPVIHK